MKGFREMIDLAQKLKDKCTYTNCCNCPFNNAEFGCELGVRNSYDIVHAPCDWQSSYLK